MVVVGAIVVDELDELEEQAVARAPPRMAVAAMREIERIFMKSCSLGLTR
jgi:hypothetical protein